ncbi:hypothetical protein HDU89_006914 [Geranomyces variabilis]|nr:hypothetical protein HDU89_006914 [Geranomyces variabilis]
MNRATVAAAPHKPRPPGGPTASTTSTTAGSLAARTAASARFAAAKVSALGGAAASSAAGRPRPAVATTSGIRAAAAAAASKAASSNGKTSPMPNVSGYSNGSNAGSPHPDASNGTPATSSGDRTTSATTTTAAGASSTASTTTTTTTRGRRAAGPDHSPTLWNRAIGDIKPKVRLPLHAPKVRVDADELSAAAAAGRKTPSSVGSTRSSSSSGVKSPPLTARRPVTPRVSSAATTTASATRPSVSSRPTTAATTTKVAAAATAATTTTPQSSSSSPARASPSLAPAAEIAKLRERQKSFQADIAERDAAFARLEAELALRDAELERKSAEFAGLLSKLHEKDAQISRLQREKNETRCRHAEEITVAHTHINRLQAQVEKISAELARRIEELPHDGSIVVIAEEIPPRPGAAEAVKQCRQLTANLQHAQREQRRISEHARQLEREHDRATRAAREAEAALALVEAELREKAQVTGALAKRIYEVKAQSDRMLAQYKAVLAENRALRKKNYEVTVAVKEADKQDAEEEGQAAHTAPATPVVQHRERREARAIVKARVTSASSPPSRPRSPVSVHREVNTVALLGVPIIDLDESPTATPCPQTPTLVRATAPANGGERVETATQVADAAAVEQRKAAALDVFADALVQDSLTSVVSDLNASAAIDAARQAQDAQLDAFAEHLVRDSTAAAIAELVAEKNHNAQQRFNVFADHLVRDSTAAAVAELTVETQRIDEKRLDVFAERLVRDSTAMAVAELAAENRRAAQYQLDAFAEQLVRNSTAAAIDELAAEAHHDAQKQLDALAEQLVRDSTSAAMAALIADNDVTRQTLGAVDEDAAASRRKKELEDARLNALAEQLVRDTTAAAIAELAEQQKAMRRRRRSFTAHKHATAYNFADLDRVAESLARDSLAAAIVELQNELPREIRSPKNVIDAVCELSSEMAAELDRVAEQLARESIAAAIAELKAEADASARETNNPTTRIPVDTPAVGHDGAAVADDITEHYLDEIATQLANDTTLAALAELNGRDSLTRDNHYQRFQHHHHTNTPATHTTPPCSGATTAANSSPARVQSPSATASLTETQQHQHGHTIASEGITANDTTAPTTPITTTTTTATNQRFSARSLRHKEDAGFVEDEEGVLGGGGGGYTAVAVGVLSPPTSPRRNGKTQGLDKNYIHDGAEREVEGGHGLAASAEMTSLPHLASTSTQSSSAQQSQANSPLLSPRSPSPPSEQPEKKRSSGMPPAVAAAWG